MKETLKLGFTLLIISVVAAAILAASNNATKGKIAEIEAEMTRQALEGIFGTVEDSKELDSAVFEQVVAENPDVVDIYEILEGGETKGYSVTTISGGFGGDIEIMAGFAKEGELLGIRLLKHSETASIGSKAAEPEFTNLFEGQDSSEEIAVETISGATITSNAVIKGVNDAREIYTGFLAN